jgi:hypothetical protein
LVGSTFEHKRRGEIPAKTAKQGVRTIYIFNCSEMSKIKIIFLPFLQIASHIKDPHFTEGSLL